MFLLYVFVGVFGLVVGSFLNALIYRLENGDSVARGRSYCPHCKHTLAWYDLIPLASFAMLGGRCRYCKRGISIQYPLVELATALVFLAIFLATRDLAQPDKLPIFTLFYLWTIASLLIVLFVYDLKHYILPDKILLPAIGIVFSYHVFEFLSFGFAWDLSPYGRSPVGGGFVVSGFAAAAFFFSIFALSKGRAMGFGDVKLALFMGLFLGWPNILVALFLAFCSGAAMGLVLIILKKKGLKSEIPFGPFLIGGTLGALFWGKQAVDWYLDLMMV